jgi:hypothetical protein
MAEERTILLKVELDVDQLEANAKAAEEQLKVLVPAMKEVRKEQGTHTKEYKEAQLEVKKYNKILTDSVKAIQANETAQKESSGSLREMRDSLEAAKVQYQNLSQEVRDSPVGQQMSADMLQLKNAINEVEQGFGTFTGSVGNYKAANQELEKTLDDIKKGLKPLADGIIAVEGAMEDLRKEGKEGSAEYKDLEKAQASLRDENKKLSGDMEHLGKDILVEVSGSISKMEDKLYDMALAGDTTSKEFIELQEQTAKYKRVVIETDRSVDALAEQGRGLSTALALSETVVAGYQAYTGITAILGTENEELLATITKLQAAQGILNSIQVIKTKLTENAIKIQQAQTKAQALYNFLIGKGTILQKAQIAVQAAAALGMKALNAVMAVNPLFLLVAVIAAVVAGLAFFSSSTKKAGEMNEQLNKTMEREHELLDTSIAKTKKLGEQRLAIAQAQGKSEKELHEIRLENLKTEEKSRKDQIAQELKDIERKKVTYRQALKEEDNELAKTIGSEIRGSRSKYKELISQNGDYNHEKKLENQKYKNFVDGEIEKEVDKNLKTAETNLDNWRKANEKRIADAKATAERIRNLTLDNESLTLDNQRSQTEAHFRLLEVAALGNAEELIKIEEEKNQEIGEIDEKERRARIDKLNSDFAIQIKNASKNAEEVALLEIEKRESIEAINIDFDSKRDEREQAYEIKKDELIIKRIEAEVNAANEISLIDKELALSKAEGTKEELEAFKALQAERVRLIKERAAAEVKVFGKTKEEIALINKRAENEIYNVNKEQFNKTDQAAKESSENRKALTLSLVNAVQQFSNVMIQIAKNQQQEEINAQAEANTQSNKLLTDQLAAGLITQAAYDAQKSALDAEYSAKQSALKEKQFKQDKAAAIINATIATAVSVAEALPNLVLAGISGGLGLAQIALIASQPTPTFEKGGGVALKNGVFGGNLHKHGGTKGVFSDGTNVEVEKDEAFFILNRKATGAISQLSNHNQKHGGAPMMARGGSLKFEGGGSFATRVSAPIENRFSQQNAMIQAAKALPNPIVDVEQIIGKIEEVVGVRNSAEVFN